jgi:hypothetical protein
MKTESFVEAFHQSRPLQRLLLRYANAELIQARQMAVCSFFHPIEARLARRLLMTSDRVRSPEFALTQALLAKMLGVRRATVNEAAGPLHQRKLINYCRGSITILDRKGLEAASCRCYVRMNELDTRGGGESNVELRLVRASRGEARCYRMDHQVPSGFTHSKSGQDLR